MKATVKDGKSGEVLHGLQGVSLSNAHVVKLGIPAEAGVYRRSLGQGKRAERFTIVVEEGEPES